MSRHLPDENPHARLRSCQRFIQYVEQLIGQAAREGRRPTWVMTTLARRCANIDLRRLRRPLHFWRSLRQLPPVRFGRSGFRAALVDDYHPARHYCAFLAVGFFLPTFLAIPFARLWEWAEGVVFGEYSRRDVDLSVLAIRHARVIRRSGIEHLPALIRRDLCQSAGDDSE
jgi:hypothetical protein